MKFPCPLKCGTLEVKKEEVPATTAAASNSPDNAQPAAYYIRGHKVTHGVPDKYGRTEGWICSICGHRSPGDMTSWGYTAC